ncbi:MAG: TolC family protein [Pseudomonadota bacterium]
MRIRIVFYPIFFTLFFFIGLPTASAEVAPSNVRQAFESAWLRSSAQQVRTARQDEIAAEQEAARSWLAGAPVVGMAQRSDRWTDNRGERETEVSVATPVWLPGQISTRREAARLGTDRFDTEIALARLTLAGEVRERLWAVALARDMLAEAEQHHHHLDMLAQDVKRRVGAGDLARTDNLLAIQEVLKAASGIHLARSKLEEANTRYTALTGLSEVISPEPEVLENLPIEQHPKLLMAKKSLERAQAAGRVTASNRSDPPTIGISMRREQEREGSGFSRSLNLAVQIPIGTATRNRPLDAAAYTGIQTASVELMQINVALQAEIDIAGQQLRTAQLANTNAAAQAALLSEHTALMEKAFRLGEGSLPELYRAQTSLHEATAAVRQQHNAVGLASARLNQAMGALP